ncbi:hypothetical protein [Ferrovibrio sp.]|uniref:hypothetical protein n=1 Tax=Ferrovibrio sp. TaxID=1917215 RepID=UPI003D131FE7
MAMAAPAYLAIAMQAGSMLMQGVTGAQQGKYNAAMAERQADETRAAAAVEEQRQRIRAQSVLSAQRARIAASGVDLEGSPLLAMEEGAANAEFDALAIRYSGSSQEARLRAQASLDRWSGQRALIGGILGAGATVAGGKSSIQRLYGPPAPQTPAPSPQPKQNLWSGGAYG